MMVTNEQTAASRTPPAPEAASASAPLPAHVPGLYSGRFWRAGIGLSRWLPDWLVDRLALALADLAWLVAAQRRRVVCHNLLPVCGTVPAARQAARRLFRQFARKLVDLWRFEGGQPVQDQFLALEGWEHLQRAADKRRGVLLITPHLGNWEFGGPILTQRGHALKIVTIAEPGGLTQMRQEARARWGIETLVIGDGGFGFVEIIRHLEAGGTVALLLDRPAPERAVDVPLFGHPFPASTAAAEVARASGCAIVPTFIVRAGRGYLASALPEIEYDRAALRRPEARVALTAKILQAFAPAIATYCDQWFHFVPLWPARDGAAAENPNPVPPS